MRRYLFDGDVGSFKQHEIEVAIIGSGIAGLYAAFNLSSDTSCMIFTKEHPKTSASSLAQGGIAVVMESDDTFEYHFKDTMKAGCDINFEPAVQTIVEEGPWDINKLISLGINFDTDSSGQLKVTMEGGHGKRRILHSGGDATGKEIVRILSVLVSQKSNITTEQDFFVVDIVTDDNDKVCGLVAFKDGFHYFKTNHVIIAAGGIGQIYRYTTNPSVATGDGIAMAKRAGAKLSDMAFIQFHPTGFYSKTSRNNQCFLISEAVRGEGGLLYNDKGERFMVGRHERAELAPRDIVARENYSEIENQASPFVKLDISFKDKDFLEKRFPTIYNTCLEYGVDITKQSIPVGPVQHYLMGGIKTDLWGKTNIQGLYVCGEAACTGVHGANRLASNSTLECLVFGRRSATSVNDQKDTLQSGEPTSEIKADVQISPQNIKSLQIKLKGIMIKYCGIIRSEKYLTVGLEKLNHLIKKIDSIALDTVPAMELYNMSMVAKAIFEAALARKKSIGAHYREDDQ
jgi:L-aspartate oxidase